MDILVDIVSPIFHVKKPRHRLNFKDTQLILDLDLESKCPSSRVKRIPREGRSICKSWGRGSYKREALRRDRGVTLESGELPALLAPL